jgi:plasmid maintenance system antidote protein VapI
LDERKAVNEIHEVKPNSSKHGESQQTWVNFKKSYQFENRREMNEIYTNAKLEMSSYHI